MWVAIANFFYFFLFQVVAAGGHAAGGGLRAVCHCRDGAGQLLAQLGQTRRSAAGSLQAVYGFAYVSLQAHPGMHRGAKICHDVIRWFRFIFLKLRHSVLLTFFFFFHLFQDEAQKLSDCEKFNN